MRWTNRCRDSWVRRQRPALCAILGFAVVAMAIPAAQAVGDRGRSSARVAKSLRAMKDQHATKTFWHRATRARARARGGNPIVTATDYSAFTLDRADLRAVLAQAPRENTAAARSNPLVLALPGPESGFQRFAIFESPIMEPGLARDHPEIKTYGGRGIDDLSATIRLDLSPLGFHASIRSAKGSWYIDPRYHNDQSEYVSYYAEDLVDSPHGAFEFKDPDETEAEGLAALDALVTHGGGPKAGTVLRTYRLALVTDPSYATYFGAANVTAAKVALMNRVDQIYEDETSVRMVLIANNDLLNLNTAALATDPNGPCGAAGCYTTAQLAGGCTGGLLTRNRIVVGQIIGASNYDIGHIALGINGGGVASLGVVGGNGKAQGCTGLPQPDGDFFAVDYVAHEMGHQYAGNHTFNGNQLNCSGGNRNGATSVEPGSGSSIMAYAGICRQDDLQPHSDPYWSERSFEEITNYVSSVRPPINEVQTASLTGFDATDSFTINYQGTDSATITNGSNYTAAGVQAALQGPSEVQTVSLTGYDTNGDSYTLAYNGTDSAPIVRGQNNTAAGIANALQGGNEQQQVVLTSFSGATQSFQVEIGGNTSAVLGSGGLAISNANVAAAVNGIAGFAGTVTSAGAGNGGFTLTFGGASAGTDVPSISIVNCTGTCTAAIRETAKGGAPIAGWPAGGTVAVGSLTDTGYTLTFSGAHQGTDVSALDVTNGSGASGSVAETTKGGAGLLPVGATAAVAGFGGGAFNTTGFQVSFGGNLGLVNVDALTLTNLNGATGFFGETAKGGPIDNQGSTVTSTGNSPPEVGTPESYTIPYRTPFALTGNATDADGDTVTYMWEQNDIGSAAVALVNANKTTGPLFRQFGTALNAAIYDPHQYNSPGENHVTTNPTRVFPDLGQILANNTNAATGDCPGAPAPPPPTSGGTNVPQALIDCYSEFLPTSVYPGPLHLRLTARDGHPSGGGVASSDTVVNLAPGTGPFLVTSQGAAATLDGLATVPVTWNVAGTDAAPISTSAVKISLSVDGGFTYPYVLAEGTPNDGSEGVTLPNVATKLARFKVEAVGNVYFDISDADVTIQAVLGANTLRSHRNGNQGGKAEAFRFTSANAGTLTQLSAFLTDRSESTRVVLGIYSNASNHPAALLAQGVVATPVNGAWNTAALGSPVPIAAGATYWIAILSPEGSGSIEYLDECCGGSGSGPSETSRSVHLTELPAAWRTGTVFKLDGPISAYGFVAP